MSVNYNECFRRTRIVAIACATVVLASCAAAPVKPAGSEDVRAKLTRLQADPDLANRAPAAVADAEAAVRDAEQPQTDVAQGAYRVYIADRKTEIARQQAQTRFYEDQRAALVAQQQTARLDARTREADKARNQAAAAIADADTQRLEARQARIEADAANANAAMLAEQAAELHRQMALLDMRETDRGLVLTLGDVLFESGKADLRAGNTGRLDKLVGFLNHYPDRTVLIEGHTDSIGGRSYNQDLSERRAESVRHYLQMQGINSGRLSAAGMADRNPVASNDSATGRQQNRRVEIVVSNPATTSR